MWLEQVLADVLKSVFIPEAESFVEGLTGKLDLKISLARTLGVLSDTDLRDLRNITTIRNRFAHRALDGTIDDPDVAPLIAQLSVQPDSKLVRSGGALILTAGSIARKLFRAPDVRGHV